MIDVDGLTKVCARQGGNRTKALVPASGIFAGVFDGFRQLPGKRPSLLLAAVPRAEGRAVSLANRGLAIVARLSHR